MKERSNELVEFIIGSAVEVHKELGPGLLENIYEKAMVIELLDRGFKVEQQVAIPVYYKGHKLDQELRLDLLVENLVIVELKAVDKLAPVHNAQLLTYLRLKKLWLGLLINFNEPMVTKGIRRVVL